MTSPCSINCVGVAFSNGLCREFVESHLMSWQQPELFVWEFQFDLNNNSIRYNLDWVLEAQFGDNKWPDGTLPAHYFENSFELPYIF